MSEIYTRIVTDTEPVKYHVLTAEQTIKDLDSNADYGLSVAEASKRFRTYGPNELAKQEPESIWDQIKEQFSDVLVRILLFAACVSFIISLTGKYFATLAKSFYLRFF
jgi:Cation transport ATPase